MTDEHLPPDQDVAADVAGLIADRVGDAMRHRLDGIDLPRAANFGVGELFGHPPNEAVIDLDDGRRVVATVTVVPAPAAGEPR